MKKAVFNVITHPLTVCNLLIVGFFILVETLHIGYHQRELTQCEEPVSIQELDATLGVTE